MNDKSSSADTAENAENHAQEASFGELLDERTAAALNRERVLLEDLRDLLVKADAEESVIKQVKGLVQHLDELFLLVIVGEVKAGKSSFINAILGEKICKEGAIPVTDKVCVLKYGNKPYERVVEDFLIEQHVDFEPLKTLNIVDTPGTNSIILQHQKITEDFIPRCDLVLFTTSADRPFTETEREFMKLISDGWAKKIIFVLNKVDIKEPEEITEIIQYIRDQCMQHFGFEPKIFPASAKQAFKAKAAKDEAAYKASGFAELEGYLFETLNQGEKLSLKLNSPVDASLKIVEMALEDFSGRLEMLKKDGEIVGNIERQLEQSEKDLNENSNRFLLEIDNVLFALEKRARDWIDDNVKVTNIGLLRNAERFRNAFEVEVVKDFEAKLDEVLHHAADWFTKKNLKVWQDTLEYFNEQVDKRSAEGAMVGKVSTTFSYNREQMFEQTQKDTREKISKFDREGQVRSMLGRISSGLAMTLGISLAAVGGATMAVILSSALAVDITGVIAGVTLVGISMFILPAKRRGMKAAFSDKIVELKRGMNEVLRKQIEDEAKEAMTRVREAIKPFTDYCEREKVRLGEQSEKLESIQRDLKEVKSDFARVAPAKD